VLPKGFRHPVAVDGRKLCLLAQLDLKELPKNDLLPPRGLLQFYIDERLDAAYGYDADHPTKQRGFRVLWFEMRTRNRSARSIMGQASRSGVRY